MSETDALRSQSQEDPSRDVFPSLPRPSRETEVSTPRDQGLTLVTMDGQHWPPDMIDDVEIGVVTTGA